jgi:hypothetical protein
MTATQTQVRRDTAANLATATPAAGELAWDTTNERLAVGNGSTAGGRRVAMAKDVQNQTFTYGTVGGTANAITLTHSIPVTSYGAGLGLSVKIATTNTGAVTINVDGLGTKNAYKMSGGSLVALDAGDFVSGGIYWLTYDGTQFQVDGIIEAVDTFPAAATGSLASVSNLVLTVDFNTYSSYDIMIDKAQAGGSTTIKIECSQDAGSSYVSATRYSKRFSSTTFASSTTNDEIYTAGREVVFLGTLMQTSTSGNAMLIYNSQRDNGDGNPAIQTGTTIYGASADIDRVKFEVSSGSMSGGSVILQPKSKR